MKIYQIILLFITINQILCTRTTIEKVEKGQYSDSQFTFNLFGVTDMNIVNCSQVTVTLSSSSNTN